MNTAELITDTAQLQDNHFYGVEVLKNILKELGLNYSIFSIMNAETWKCQNYACGKRYREPVDTCLSCGAPVTQPIIPSPRTPGGGKGSGHRRYSGAEIKHIVDIFAQQR